MSDKSELLFVESNMGKTYPVRLSVINYASEAQEMLFESIAVKGICHADPDDVFELVGVVHCYAAKVNSDERDFFNQLFRLHNKNK